MGRIIWDYNAPWGDFFFEAMSGEMSYAGGGKAEPISDMPGWKGYRVEKGPFLLVDRYVVLPDGSSLGFTTEWENGQTRLHMSYGGHYPKPLVSFLKQVLLEAYSRKAWRGGRGLDDRSHAEQGRVMYKYHNIVQPLDRVLCKKILIIPSQSSDFLPAWSLSAPMTDGIRSGTIRIMAF